MVPPIDQDDLCIASPQRMRRGQAGKTGADDHDPLLYARLRGGDGHFFPLRGSSSVSVMFRLLR